MKPTAQVKCFANKDSCYPCVSLFSCNGYLGSAGKGTTATATAWSTRQPTDDTRIAMAVTSIEDTARLQAVCNKASSGAQGISFQHQPSPITVGCHEKEEMLSSSLAPHRLARGTPILQFGYPSKVQHFHPSRVQALYFPPPRLSLGNQFPWIPS
nr:uncharacterized protein LOC128686830 [Cherax quadricarinatus]XP_053629933.1 uncharacterized protein LOC128686830 [Cherax quadricarinatus]